MHQLAAAPTSVWRAQSELFGPMPDEKALIEDGASPAPIKICSAPSKICPLPIKICPPEDVAQGSAAQNLSGAGQRSSGADQNLSGTRQKLSDAGLHLSGTDQFLFDTFRSRRSLYEPGTWVTFLRH